MGRETPAEKAARLLVAGAVKITHVLGEQVEGRVSGDSGTTHRVTYERRQGWCCTCPFRAAVRGRACAHILAVALVAGRTARQQRTAEPQGRLTAGRLRAAQAEATRVHNGGA